MSTKRIKLDDATTMASVDGTEMLELLDQFENTPVISQAKSIDQTLMQMESDIISIRSSLEKKPPKKLSLKDIDRKLDIIIKMLNDRGDSYRSIHTHDLVEQTFIPI